ncbi:MAG: hypothetical protein K9J72_10540 [Synechococcus sp. Tobar2m-G35]|jgi:hypothetical protein|nr:hypothetical protein [Synechococcus sp. Tobar2m-G35]
MDITGVLACMYLPNIISIGSNCRTRFHIERTLRRSHPEVDYPAFFWDWLEGGGVQGIGWCLRNNFFLKAADFAVQALGPAGPYVPLHEPSGFLFHHDFGGAASEAMAAHAGLMDSLPESLQKYNYLATRTKALIESDHPIVLVYLGALTIADYEELDLLFDLKSQNRRLVNVLVCEDAGRALVDRNLDTFLVDDNAADLQHPVWQGHHEDWDRVFREIPLRPDYYHV